MVRKDSDSEDMATDKATNSSDEDSVQDEEICSVSKFQRFKVQVYPEPSLRHAASGIHFYPGVRLEAKDMGRDIWYGVKVVDVDLKDHEVLIHFENWSQRYDEWVQMDSSRLRQPSQSKAEPQPSAPEKKKKKQEKEKKEKKEKKKIIEDDREFSDNEQVMAMWTDTRKYGAVIKKVLPEDKYEVLFLDGYKKILKGSKISKFVEGQFENAYELKPPRGLSRSIPTFPPKSLLGPSNEVLCSKEERRERKRKINVTELFQLNKRQRVSLSQPKVSRRKLEEASTSQQEEPKKREEAVSKPRGEEPKQREEAPSKSQVEESRKRDEAGNKTRREVSRKREEAISNVSREEPKKREGVSRTRRGELKKREEATRQLREDEARKREEASKVRDEEPKKLVRKTKLREEEPKKPAENKTPTLRGNSKKLHRKASQDTPSSAKTHTGTPKAEREVGKGKKDLIPADEDDGMHWEPEGEAAWIVDSSEGPRKSIIVQDLRLPKNWTKHTIQRRGGDSAGKWDVFLVSPSGRKFRSRNELRSFFDESGELFPADAFDFSLGKRNYVRVRKDMTPPSKSSSKPSSKPSRKPPSKTPSKPPSKAPSKPSSSTKGNKIASSKIASTSEVTIQDQAPMRRVKTLLPKVRLQQPSVRTTSSPPPPHSTSGGPAIPTPLIEENQVIIGRLKIEVENDMYKCPKETCCKMFRKENLLQMHLKHYHPEYNSLRGETPNVADLAYARTIADSLQGSSSPRHSKSALLAFSPKADLPERKKQPRKPPKRITGGYKALNFTLRAITEYWSRQDGYSKFRVKNKTCDVITSR